MKNSSVDKSQQNKKNMAAERKKIVARSMRDFEAISRQIVRFGRMAPENLMAHMRTHKEDLFCNVPHSSGNGTIICGAIAQQKFTNLVDRVIEFEPLLARRVSHNKVREHLIEFFVQQVLKEKQALSHVTTESILNEVAEKAKKTLKVTEHFLPCVLFHNGGPNEFSVGPVKFTRRIKFFGRIKNNLRRSTLLDIENHIALVASAAAKGYPADRLATTEQSEKIVRSILARTLKTYHLYPWIAQVKIIDCDKQVSDELARQTVEAALHVVRLLLGANVTSRVRLAWSRGDALRTAGMWEDESGAIHTNISSGSLGPVGMENWHDGLMQIDGHELHILGSALSALANPRPIFHLHQRILDSIHWFGDAATELEPTSRIIKYTSGIERLLFGKYKPGSKVALAKRLSAICAAFGCDEKNTIYHDALNVYETRSALLHGELSPRHENAIKFAHLAEDLCRLCILCTSQLFPAILQKNGEVNSEQLENIMEEISKDAATALSKFGTISEKVTC
jgi:hypothetical protein